VLPDTLKVVNESHLTDLNRTKVHNFNIQTMKYISTVLTADSHWVQLVYCAKCFHWQNSPFVKQETQCTYNYTSRHVHTLFLPSQLS